MQTQGVLKKDYDIVDYKVLSEKFQTFDLIDLF